MPSTAHRIGLAAVLGTAALAGTIALGSTVDLGADAQKAKPVSKKEIRERAAALRANQRKLREAARARPPKLPKRPKFDPLPEPVAPPLVIVRGGGGGGGGTASASAPAPSTTHSGNTGARRPGGEDNLPELPARRTSPAAAPSGAASPSQPAASGPSSETRHTERHDNENDKHETDGNRNGGGGDD